MNVLLHMWLWCCALCNSFILWWIQFSQVCRRVLFWEPKNDPAGWWKPPQHCICSAAADKCLTVTTEVWWWTYVKLSNILFLSRAVVALHYGPHIHHIFIILSFQRFRVGMGPKHVEDWIPEIWNCLELGLVPQSGWCTPNSSGQNQQCRFVFHGA